MTSYLLRVCLWLLALWLLQEPTQAQGGLNIFVTDMSKVAVGGFKITCAAGCSTEPVFQGRAKIAIPVQKQPGDRVVLRLVPFPTRPLEWIMKEPMDGAITIPRPPIENIEVRVIKKTIVNVIERERITAQPHLNRETSRQDLIEKLAQELGISEAEVIKRLNPTTSREQALVALAKGDHETANRYFDEINSKQKEDLQTISNNMFLHGQSLYNQGRYNEAITRFSDALSITKDNANIIHWLGASLFQAGRYNEAKPHLIRALELYKNELGPWDAQLATSLNNLAELHRVQGNYGEAEPLFRRALRIRETNPDRETPSVAESLNSLGVLYQTQGKLTESEDYFKQAYRLVISSKRGLNRLELASICNSLATLYNEEKKYSEAERYFTQAVSNIRYELGPNHPQLGWVLTNQATLYYAQGNYRKAEAINRKAYEIVEKALGKNHPRIGLILNNTAVAMSLSKDYQEAERVYKQSLAILIQSLGTNHSLVASTLTNLANCYRDQDKYAEAEDRYKEVLKIWEAMPSDNSSHIVNTLENYISLLKKRNQKEDMREIEKLETYMKNKVKASQ